MKSLVETILSRKLHDPKVAIYKWLDEHDIKNYSLNNKGEVDVDGSVDLSDYSLTEFPSFIQFGVVKGNFNCSRIGLTSLRGAPKEVGESFYCHNNNLTTLEGSPEKVGGRFDCSYNNLTSLKGAPREVGGDFRCSNNSTKFSKDDVKKVCKVSSKIDV